MRMRAMQFTHALLRIVAGLLLMQHGGQKLFGWFGGVGPNGGTVTLMSLMGFAGVLEFFGGSALILGLITRPVAFLLSGEMAVAYFTAHQPHGTWPIQNHGEPAALLSFVFLFYAAHGAGPMSVDAWFRRRRGSTVEAPIEVPRPTIRGAA